MTTSDKFRVLIVDDVAETRENVRKLLQFETDVEVVGVARTGREAIDVAQDVEPDVVLMDINMPDMDGITATETIRKKKPFIQVVILSVQGDQNYMRRAMLAGARDFLTKPPMGDELISAIRRAGLMAHQEKAMQAAVPAAAKTSGSGSVSAKSAMMGAQGKVICVYSPKGGTGSTMIAVNLAVALHNDETRSVIVDGDFQFGDVAVFINEQGKNTVIDLAPRVSELDPEIVGSVMVKHAESGVHVLAAPARPEQAEEVSGKNFQQILKYLRRLYAYVIVDTSAWLSDAVLSAVDESDLLVLVVTQDIPAIKNARLFLDLTSTLGVPRERIALTMNQYDKRIGITPEKVAENLKVEIASTIPLDEKTVIPSVNRGIPFILGNKSQPVSRGILTLAEALRERIVSLEIEQ